MNILGNLPPDRHQNYGEWVAALETRYGSRHRTEMARARFKHRVKQKDESLAAMAEGYSTATLLKATLLKATLLLTIPRSLFKSSAKDFALEKLDFGRFSA